MTFVKKYFYRIDWTYFSEHHDKQVENMLFWGRWRHCLSMLTILVPAGVIRIMILGHRANMPDFTTATFFWRHRHKLCRENPNVDVNIINIIDQEGHWRYRVWTFRTRVAQSEHNWFWGRNNCRVTFQLLFLLHFQGTVTKAY